MYFYAINLMIFSFLPNLVFLLNRDYSIVIFLTFHVDVIRLVKSQIVKRVETVHHLVKTLIIYESFLLNRSKRKDIDTGVVDVKEVFGNVAKKACAAGLPQLKSFVLE